MCFLLLLQDDKAEADSENDAVAESDKCDEDDGVDTVVKTEKHEDANENEIDIDAIDELVGFVVVAVDVGANDCCILQY